MRGLARWMTSWLVWGAGCGLAAEPPRPVVSLADTGFALRLPQQDGLSFHGQLSLDDAGGSTTSLLYPAPNLVGLLAAIATHGAMEEARKNSERTRLQDSADQVLAPFHDRLAELGHRQLMQQAVLRLPGNGPRSLLEADALAPDTWTLESQPSYVLTQDRSAVILDNVVTLYAAGTSTAPVWRNVVRVVSDAQPAGQPDEAGTARWLTEQSQALLTHSLRLTMDELRTAPGAQPEVQRTFRFTEGSRQRVERGSLLATGCQRLVLRNLRGWILSVPAPVATATSATPVAAPALASPPPVDPTPANCPPLG